MQTKELIGKRIKELRKSRNMSQEFLAEQLGIEPRQLSKLETGKHYPSFETMSNLLKILGISFEDFINIEHLSSEFNTEREIMALIGKLDDNQLQIVYKILKALIN